MNCKNLILVPYFEDVAAAEFCLDLKQNMGADDALLVVDDGSVELPFDQAWMQDNGIEGQIIRLVRNVGHQQALHAGLSYAVNSIAFETLTLLDSDGEDLPSDIKNLLAKLSDNIDVVVAKRRSRIETLKFKMLYQVYRWLFRVLVGQVISFGNFMVMRRAAAKRLSISSEAQLHVAASVINSRLKFTELSLDRGKRYRGTSRMNWVSLTLHGLRSVMVFSDQVMVRITLLSVAFGALAILAMLVMTVLKITGLAIPGWYSTGGGILILMLTQAGFMAMMMLLLSGKFMNKTVLDKDHYKSVIDHIDQV